MVFSSPLLSADVLLISVLMCYICFFFFSSRRRHTRSDRDWSSDVCSSDLGGYPMTRSWHVAALSLALLLLAGAAATAAEIDAKRLMNADKEADNWLTYHGS